MTIPEKNNNYVGPFRLPKMVSLLAALIHIHPNMQSRTADAIYVQYLGSLLQVLYDVSLGQSLRSNVSRHEVSGPAFPQSPSGLLVHQAVGVVPDPP